MSVRVSDSFTRPANATAYAAKDVVGDGAELTFAGAGAASPMLGGVCTVTQAKLLTDQTTNTARFRLHLYRSAPTDIADNAAFTGPLWADRAEYIGAIDFPACGVEGTGATAAYAVNPDVVLSWVQDDSDRNIYGVLETLDAFTPASGQNVYIELTVEGEHVGG